MPAHDLDSIVCDVLDAKIDNGEFAPPEGYAAAPDFGALRKRAVAALQALDLDLDKLGTIPIPQLEVIKDAVANVVNAALLLDKLIPAAS